MNEQKKLKPVIFVKGDYAYHRQNTLQQNLLLKAMQVTADPKKLREMIGVRSVAEVYRTLDKIAIRREYHEALLRQGIDLDTIVTGIKKICNGRESGAIRLKGYQILLKSLGLDAYDGNIEGGNLNWEELIKEKSDKQDINSLSDEPTDKSLIEYKVKRPELLEDEDEEAKINEDEKLGKSLYE